MGIEFLLKKMQPRIELMMKQELLNIFFCGYKHFQSHS